MILLNYTKNVYENKMVKIINKNEKNLEQYKDEKDINIELYKLFERASNIKKFPKIYKSFLEKNSEYLIYQMKNFTIIITMKMMILLKK